MSRRSFLADHCDYDFEEDSDQERAESSEDEIDIILHGTVSERLQLRRRSLGEVSSSSEDDFEKAMDKELEETVREIEHQREDHSSVGDGIAGSTLATIKEPKLDPVTGQPALSNDDLLYDPNLDNEDAIWVAQCRQKYQVKGQRSKGADQKLPQSDAVLNCPACMVTLCRDCQRHSIYKTQYRAMFVQNCRVDSEELRNCPTKKDRKRKTKPSQWTATPGNDHSEAAGTQPVVKQPKLTTQHRPGEGQSMESESELTTRVNSSENDTSNASYNATQPISDAPMDTTKAPVPVDISSVAMVADNNDELYHPVFCTECNTEVAVYDQDEVYHFYNVLSSYT